MKHPENNQIVLSIMKELADKCEWETSGPIRHDQLPEYIACCGDFECDSMSWVFRKNGITLTYSENGTNAGYGRGNDFVAAEWDMFETFHKLICGNSTLSEEAEFASGRLVYTALGTWEEEPLEMQLVVWRDGTFQIAPFVGCM
jgi:hypothetical protein